MFADAAGIAARIIAKQAYFHAVSILFGFTEDPTSDLVPDVHIASAGLIEIDGRSCAVTCEHAIAGFETLYACEPRYKFQIGSFVCAPAERLIDADKALDLAILDVSDVPINQLSGRDDGTVQPLRPVRWPPDLPRSEDLVVLCGFPIGTREVDVMGKRFTSVALPLVEHVRDVDTDSFTISFNREQWVNIPTDAKAPREIRDVDVNGLSGSPVFSALRNVQGAIGVMEYLGTVLSEIPFGEPGVRVRSSRCIGADGRISR